MVVEWSGTISLSQDFASDGMTVTFSLFKANQRNYKSWPSCGSLSVEPSREADTLWDGWMCDDDDKLDFSRGNFDQVPACLPNFLSSAAEHTQDLLLSSNERA